MRNKQAITAYYGMALIALLMIFAFGCTNISGNYVESKKSALSESEMETSIETARSSPSANASDADVSKDSGVTDSGTEFQSDGGLSINKLFSENIIVLHKNTKAAKRVDRIKNIIGVSRVRIATINFDALTKSALEMNLFDNVMPTITKRDINIRGFNNYSWSSEYDHETGEANFTVVDGVLEGLYQKGNDVYRIRRIGERIYIIIDYDERKAIEYDCNTSKGSIKNLAKKVNATPPNIVDAGSKGSKSSYQPARILVGYTKEAADFVETDGYYSTMKAEAQFFIDQMNNSFENSEIDDDVSVELVRVLEFDYEEYDQGTSAENELKDLERWTFSLEELPPGGNGPYMDDVHYYERWDYTADICVLIRHANAGGRAYTIEADYTTSFAVTSNHDMDSQNEVVRIVVGMVFAHEVGHLYGCCHHVEECENNPACDPEEDDPCYNTSDHGFCRTTTPKYRTIMATDKYCSETRTNWWSDPDWTPYARGVANESDCSAKMVSRADTMATLVATPSNLSLPALNVESGEYASAIATTSISNPSTTSYRVKYGAEVIFKAPTITLRKGFKADNGSMFRAYR